MKRYPNLGGALDRLGEKWRRNRPAFARSPSLYHRWLDALAVQWADEALAGAVDGKDLWRAKRLQTGLASFATLRHTTVLVNERTAAEAGEGGWEEIVPKPPARLGRSRPGLFRGDRGPLRRRRGPREGREIRLDGIVPGSELGSTAAASRSGRESSSGSRKSRRRRASSRGWRARSSPERRSRRPTTTRSPTWGAWPSTTSSSSRASRTRSSGSPTPTRCPRSSTSRAGETGPATS